jgi:hypothetical protein
VLVGGAQDGERCVDDRLPVSWSRCRIACRCFVAVCTGIICHVLRGYAHRS